MEILKKLYLFPKRNGHFLNRMPYYGISLGNSVEFYIKEKKEHFFLNFLFLN
jgi:hypothetical protein